MQKKQNNKQSISIVIPTKNEEKNILRCLRSIKKQKVNASIEIILVDNHSLDNTVKLAKPFVNKTIIKGPERSAQRNIGARIARGKWLLFIDADMELSAGALQECLDLAKNRMVDPIIIINEKGVGHTFLGKAIALEKNCYQYASWLQAARFFPREFFAKLGGYDESLIAGEDWDLTQRFRDEGFPIFITFKSFLIHHESQDNLVEVYRKELYYINHINPYATKHPFAFSYQGSFLYRVFVWLRSWANLAKNPLLTITFLSIKFSVWLIWQWRRQDLTVKNLE